MFFLWNVDDFTLSSKCFYFCLVCCPVFIFVRGVLTALESVVCWHIYFQSVVCSQLLFTQLSTYHWQKYKRATHHEINYLGIRSLNSKGYSYGSCQHTTDKLIAVFVSVACWQLFPRVWCQHTTAVNTHLTKI